MAPKTSISACGSLLAALIFGITWASQNKTRTKHETRSGKRLEDDGACSSLQRRWVEDDKDEEKSRRHHLLYWEAAAQ